MELEVKMIKDSTPRKITIELTGDEFKALKDLDYEIGDDRFIFFCNDEQADLIIAFLEEVELAK